MKIFGGRGAILIQVLGGTALFVSAEGCSDKSGPEVESSEPSNLGGIDRSAIRDILPGADIVRDLTVIPTSSDRRKVEFKALGHAFALRLERNYELFSPDLVVVRDGIEMSARDAGVVPPFRGYVEGDPKSWVRVNLRNELVEGIVFTQGDLFEVRPSAEDPNARTMARGSLSDYIDNPTGAGDANCGVIGEAPPYTGTEIPLMPQSCTWIGVHMISDYTHCAKNGNTPASCESEMNTRMNEIDGIYRADINHGFRVEKLTTHQAVGGPGYNVAGLDINAHLDAVTAWKSANDAARGVVQVYAGRVTSGAVGLAWVGALCKPGNASSVSNYLGTGRGTTICAAHEMGHNFGASHDASGAAYIMAPSVNASATTFSSASKSAINSHVASVSCFSPCGTAGTGGTGGAAGSGGAAGTGGTAGKGGTGGTGGAAGTGGTAGKAGAAGTGGASGTGGTTGTGGASGSGGTTGTGGASGTGGTTGTGGASGSGGVGGTGGAAGSGGAAGVGGVGGAAGATGGSAGKGGTAGGGTGGSATGGSTGTGATGGTTGTGGTTTTGGAGGSTTGAGGTSTGGTDSGGRGGTTTGGRAGSTPPTDPGCGCRVVAPSETGSRGGFAGLVLALGATLMRRRSRRSRGISG